MRKADELLQGFLDSIGQSEGAVYVGLFRQWGVIAGERIAAHAHPVDIRGSSLVIEADHPGWVQMVMLKRTRILSAVQSRFPELGVTGLMVRVVSDSPIQETKPLPDEQEVKTPPTADDSEALGRIQDEEMKETLKRLQQELHE